MPKEALVPVTEIREKLTLYKAVKFDHTMSIEV